MQTTLLASFSPAADRGARVAPSLEPPAIVGPPGTGPLVMPPRWHLAEGDASRPDFWRSLGPGARAVLIGASVAPTLLTGSGAVAAHGAPLTTVRESEALARNILFHEDAVSGVNWNPAAQPVLRWGSHGAALTALETRLSELGYTDSSQHEVRYGRHLRTAVLEYQFDHRDQLRTTGVVDRATWALLAEVQPSRAAPPTTTPGGLPLLSEYPPGAPETVALFAEAATSAGLPAEWARSPALHMLLVHESNGMVGRPNYTYHARAADPARWREVEAELRAGIKSARSSASGLGQLLLDNVDDLYPSGRAGIGNAFEEAVGMLRYIHDRYDTPQKAWAAYNRYHEGY